MNELRRRITAKLQECEHIMHARGIAAPAYNIKEVDGQVAGKCRSEQGGKIITLLFNFKLAFNPANTERFVNQTVPHEYAHAVDFYNNGSSGHGRPWKLLMTVLGVPATRCHNYDMSTAKVRKTRKKVVQCGCGPLAIGLITFRRILQGTNYRCKNCSQRIRL